MSLAANLPRVFAVAVGVNHLYDINCRKNKVACENDRAAYILRDFGEQLEKGGGNQKRKEMKKASQSISQYIRVADRESNMSVNVIHCQIRFLRTRKYLQEVNDTKLKLSRCQ